MCTRAEHYVLSPQLRFHDSKHTKQAAWEWTTETFNFCKPAHVVFQQYLGQRMDGATPNVQCTPGPGQLNTATVAACMHMPDYNLVLKHMEPAHTKFGDASLLLRHMLASCKLLHNSEHKSKMHPTHGHNMCAWLLEPKALLRPLTARLRQRPPAVPLRALGRLSIQTT